MVRKDEENYLKEGKAIGRKEGRKGVRKGEKRTQSKGDSDEKWKEERQW